MDNFEKYQTEGEYAEVAKKYLTEDNQRVITVTTVPAPGQQEAIEADLAAKLAETKAAMSARGNRPACGGHHRAGQRRHWRMH